MAFNLSVILTFFQSLTGDLFSRLLAGLAFLLLIVYGLHLLRFFDKAGRKVAIGASILLGIQVFLAIANLLTDHTSPESAFRFSLLAYACLSCTVVWLTWTFLEPKRAILQTGLALFLTAITVILAAVSLLVLALSPTAWSLPAATIRTLWGVFTLVLAGGSFVLILIYQPPQWGVGMMILVLVGAGSLAEMGAAGEYGPAPGFLNLAQTLGLPWLLVWVRRYPHRKSQDAALSSSVDLSSKDQVVDTKPTLVDQLLKINLQESPEDTRFAIAKAISLATVADIVYLVQSQPEEDNVVLVAGYDLIREIPFPVTTLPTESLLHITDAWTEGRPLRLSEINANLRDMQTLTRLLKVHRVGHLLAYPLQAPDLPVTGGILLLSPYTDKVWGSETMRLLDETKTALARALWGANQVETLTQSLSEKSDTILALQQTQKTLANALIQKEAALTELQTDLKQLKARYQLEKFESIREIEALTEQLRQAPKSVATPSGESLLATPSQLDHLRAQVHQLTRERDDLRTALARAQAQIQELITQSGQTGPTQLSIDQKMITLDSIAANVRLKVSAILQQKAQTLQIINPDGRKMIKTDPALLQRVLHGLLENAALASPHGGVVQLEQSLSMETGMLIAEVTDHGVGLSPEEQTALFSGQRKTLPGIGSVSAIRRAIQAIRVLNGKIWLRSEKNRSTTFRIQLPIRIID